MWCRATSKRVVGDTQEVISGQIRQRQDSPRVARQKTLLLQQGEQDLLTAGVAGSMSWRHRYCDQRGQRSRIKLADSAQRYRNPDGKGYLSPRGIRPKRAELLNNAINCRPCCADRIGLAMDSVHAPAALADLACANRTNWRS